jgi:hypothetical protein
MPAATLERDQGCGGTQNARRGRHGFVPNRRENRTHEPCAGIGRHQALQILEISISEDLGQQLGLVAGQIPSQPLI